MAKYTEKQKLDAVRAYERGAGGLRATAEANGVNVASLRNWIALFRAGGPAGVAPKKKAYYDAEFKLEVLRRMEDEGLSSRQAAALFGVRRFDQVADWSRRYAEHGVAALQPRWKATRDQMKKTPVKHEDGEPPVGHDRSRAELLRELQQLRMENAYLKKVHALVRAKTRSAPKKGR